MSIPDNTGTSGSEINPAVLYQGNPSQSKGWDEYELPDIQNQIEAISKRGTAILTGLLPIPEIFDMLRDIFKCQKCGRCCRDRLNENDRGVEITDKDISVIAQFIKQRPRRMKRMARHDKDDRWLLPKPCPFYTEEFCRVYPVRPVVCQNYPFLTGIRNDYSAQLDGNPFIHISSTCPAGKEMGLWSLSTQAVLQKRLRYGIEPSVELLASIPAEFAERYMKALHIMSRKLGGTEPFDLLRFGEDLS